jgi:tRNA1(Val) A37 N6-methylase TrmN6
MRELTRTNDPVFLSYLIAELKSEGIEHLVLDAFASTLLAPMNATALQRIMVDEDDYWQAWGVLVEAEEQVTEDTFLDGRLVMLQPKEGFRVSIDPIILAATVPVSSGDRVLDVGTGSGAAALALLVREPWAWVTGIDIQEKMIALANRSAVRNRMQERVNFVVSDVIAGVPDDQVGAFDHVMSNPPFFAHGSGQIPKNKARALATVESSANLAVWVDFMVLAVRDGGTITLVHRAEREDELVGFLKRQCGDMAVMDLTSKAGEAAQKLIVVQAVKGGTAKNVSRRELVLHHAGDDFTEDALAILRDAQFAPISPP